MTQERWQRIELLYNAALEREPKQRTAYVSEACEGDHDLEQQVVSLLLRDASDPQALLNRQVGIAAKPGIRIGAFELQTLLGTGSMGEVWQARDTKLGRQVAIKLLPTALADDSQFMARFEREAQLLARINHPNIATAYCVEQGALVMELVDGLTLDQRFKGVTLQLREALPIARQIAAGLAAAHELGIIHRDIKPGNIKLTSAGVIKILDFGLAKTREQGREGETPTPEMTELGMILGTASYMAPEQARGENVDQRADIWAFGVVLYEMLTGKRLFRGETVSDTIAAVLTREPDWQRVPASAERVLKLCLQKDPKHRFQNVGDAILLLEAESKEPAQATRFAPRKVWIGVAAVAALLAILLLVRFGRQQPTRGQVIRFAIAPPASSSYDQPLAALSPDGKHIVFPAETAPGRWNFLLRSLDSTLAQPVAGTGDADLPFWSPDGRSIGFYASGKLRKIDLSVGPAVALAEAPSFRGASWSSRGMILFAPTRTTALFSISASGGSPMPATALDRAHKEGSHRWPCFLPDGAHFLYSAVATDGESVTSDSTIYVGSLDSNERRMVITHANSNAIYASGYLLFLRENTLMAQPFDAKSLSTTGDAIRVVEQVGADPMSAVGYFGASEKGVLAYQPVAQTLQRLAWLDQTGKLLTAIGSPGRFEQTSLSPDGKRATVSVFNNASHNYDLWIYDLTRNLSSRLTPESAGDASANEFAGIWSPDGQEIVFNCSAKGRLDLYRRNASGAGAEELLYSDGLSKTPTSWSPDGKFILFTSTSAPKTGDDLWVLPLAKGAKPFPFLKTVFNESGAQFSPDGNWIAFQSNETGHDEIYIAPFPASGAKTQVSVGGASWARWRSDGTALFYLAKDGRLVATNIGLKRDAVVIGKSKPLFGPLGRLGNSPYDVSAEGHRFFALLPTDAALPEPLTVVLNWTESITLRNSDLLPGPETGWWKSGSQ